MNLSSWKDALQEKALIGSFVTFASPSLTEFTAALGFDFTLLDNEHGNMDQMTLENMCRASQCRGVPSIVRVPVNEYDHIQKALDFGADGVQVPMIHTPEDAQKVVDLANFPPAGIRGTAFLTRAANYGLYEDKLDYIRKANESKFAGIHIETTKAVENLDAILEVDGIDMYFIGPGDLAISMGLAPGHPNVLEVMKKSILKIRSKGKIAGTYTGTPALTKEVIKWGATYIVTAITPYMVSGAKEFLQEVRSDDGRRMI